jgi:hypothetical protein
MSHKKVSVIVITHNGRHHLKECFESLEKQTYKDFSVYLLDNASTDGSSNYVKKNFPWIRIIRFDKNYGFAEGYNRAIKMVNTEYVALLNDDTKVHPRWLEELFKAIDKDASLFAVGSKILFYDRPDTINHAGAKITIIGAGIDVGFGEKDSPAFNKQKYVGAVCGAAMLVRRKIFEELGGFDEDYFAYFEDLDLCWRAWLRGYKVMYVPTSVVYHKYGGSWGGRASPRRIYYTQKNRLTNIVKNFELRNVVKGLIVSICFDIVRILLFLIRREFGNIRAISRANVYFLKQLPETLEKRRRAQRNRMLSDTELYRMNLIILLWESVKEFIRLEGLG